MSLHRSGAFRVTDLVNHHISGEDWRGLVRQARQAAERGEKEFLLLHFRSRLCSDAGRAVKCERAALAGDLARRSGGNLPPVEARSQAEWFPVGGPGP